MIKLDLYDTLVHVKVYKDRESLIKAYNKFDKKLNTQDPATEEFQGCVLSDPLDLTKIYILLNEYDLTISTITHEVYHATEAITRANGIEDEESSAILNGHLNEKVFKFLRKKWPI